jgi:hypothetical protein
MNISQMTVSRIEKTMIWIKGDCDSYTKAVAFIVYDTTFDIIDISHYLRRRKWNTILMKR